MGPQSELIEIHTCAIKTQQLMQSDIQHFHVLQKHNVNDHAHELGYFPCMHTYDVIYHKLLQLMIKINVKLNKLHSCC